MTEPNSSQTQFYVAGGTMNAEANSYVVRQADSELLAATLAGEFCYVLTPRQMGKSSLMTRTALKLREAGVMSAQVDLTSVGADKSSVSADQWFYSVAFCINKDLKIDVRLDSWWKERVLLSPAQRFSEFLTNIVLEKCPSKIVVFIDEIDSTIGLPFSDDFFAGIRACYNQRARSKAFERLSFVLLGVATPAQLISDPTRTPFNIGFGIELSDFSIEEASQLAHGLHNDADRALALLQRIFYWTAGHPYLTQAICRAVAEGGGEISVDGIVEEKFFSANASKEEKNLKFVRDRLTQSGVDLRKVLQTYRRLAEGKTIPDIPASTVHAALKLSGVAKPNSQGQLTIRNRIYSHVFDARWAAQETPPDRVRYVVFASTLLFFIAFAVWYSFYQPRASIKTLQTVTSDDSVAYDAYESLRQNIVQRNRAEELFALYWARRQDRDSMLMAELRSLTRKDDTLVRSVITDLVGEDYAKLAFTFRHGGSIEAVAFSPDGKTVLTGSDDNTARLWWTDSGAPVGSPMQHKGSVTTVAFSPDGKTVLTGSSDKTAQLWRADTGAPVGAPMQHAGSVNTVAFSPDGKTVLTGSGDKTARLWRADTGAPLGAPMQHEDAVYSVAFSPNGKTVLTGSLDKTARLWRANTGAPVGSAMHHNGTVYGVAFSPNGKSVLTGSLDKTARLWRADNGAPVGWPMQHEGDVNAVAFSPDGKTVLTGSDGGTACLWRADNGVPFGSTMMHAGDVTAVAFSPDGKTVLTGSSDHSARLWRADNGAPIGSAMMHADYINAVAFSPDGKTVLTGSDDDTARLWRVDSDATVGLILRSKGAINDADFAVDGKTVLTGSEDHTAQFWRSDNGALIGPPMQHQDPVKRVYFSENGKIALTVTSANVARAWRRDNSAPAGPSFQMEADSTMFQLSPDGKTLFSFKGDAGRLQRTDSGALIGSLRPGGGITVGAFSPDGKTIITVDSDNAARLWRAGNAAPFGSPMRHRDTINVVAFSPDSKIVLTGSHDLTARLWRADSGAPVGSPWFHKNSVTDAAFSPDGKTVLTVAVYETQLWRVEGGIPVGPPLRHEATVDDVGFSSDGKTFLTTSGLWVYLWDYRSSVLVSAKPVFGLILGAQFVRSPVPKLLAGLPVGDSQLIIRNIDFEHPSRYFIRGEAEALLAEWSAKLALTFDPHGHITPLYSVPSTNRARK